MKGVIALVWISMIIPVVIAGTAPLHIAEEKEDDNLYLVGLQDDHDVGEWVEAFHAHVRESTFDGKITDTNDRILTAELDPEALSHVREMEGVSYVEEDGVVSLADLLIYKEEIFEDGLENWGLDRIDQENLPLDDRFEISGTGKGTHVYILDSGIRATHHDIRGRADAAFDAYGGNGTDIDGHGTHCAGIIAGTKYGVAKEAYVHGVRVIKENRKGSVSAVVRAMHWVAKNGSRPCVASMSFSGKGSKSLDTMAQALYDSGCVLAVAASNEHADSCGRSPARVKDVITVGATNELDYRSFFSDFGKCVDIFAPGEHIRSLDYHSDDAHISMSGTSMATPFVSGAAAVLSGRGYKHDEVKAKMMDLASKGVVKSKGKDSPNRLLHLDTFRDVDL